MTTVVFAGPTVSPDDGRRVLDAIYLPPAAQGDVYDAAQQGATAIALIDGYFERVPAVWHKEILFALARGVHVYGAASMGALRAAELAPFGMRGVGAIYRWFRAGALTGDDEVAVAHGPADTGFRPISEAMVNIRATVARAVRDGVLRPHTAAAVVGVAKSLFYPERAYPTVLRRALDAGASPAEVEALGRWLPGHSVNQKRRDALRLLRALTRVDAARPLPDAVRPYFEETEFWQLAAAERQG